MVKSTSLLIVLTLLVFCVVAKKAKIQKDTVLRTRADGTFKIVQFTDLHFGEDPIKDLNSTIRQGVILDAEKPDLVIMTGDSVSGYAWDNRPNWFAPLWANLTRPMEERKVKYAFTFGNHDDEADLTRDEIVDLDMKNPMSLTQKGPKDINGTTNYVLLIYSYDVNNPVPVAALYMLDSSDNNCEGATGWGCVYPNQIEWYMDTSAALRKKFGKVIPAMAYFHIPVPEFMYMWNNNTCMGRLEDTGVCCFSVNTGLFAAFKEMKDVISVHCGHDHNNDFYGEYLGIQLAYGRKTGYGGYGPPNGWLRGARVMQVVEYPFQVNHWIRQEDATVVQSTQQPSHPPDSKDQWNYCCGTYEAVVLNGTSNCERYSRSFTPLDFDNDH